MEHFFTEENEQSPNGALLQDTLMAIYKATVEEVRS